jgi:hypothetical protein
MSELDRAMKIVSSKRGAMQAGRGDGAKLTRDHTLNVLINNILVDEAAKNQISQSIADEVDKAI